MANDPTYSDGLKWRVSGVRAHPFTDLYGRLMVAPWTVTIAVAFAAYVGTAVVFASLYSLDSAAVRGATTWMDHLWFSVQTISTIGYGGMTPASPWANVLVILESFIGLAGVAVITAILYAKFSLPDARVRFSSALAVHDRDGVPTLHIRMVNERVTPILDASVSVSVLVDESHGDSRFRRLVDLKLVRSEIPLFAMAFTAMHVMDDTSPLHTLVKDGDRLLFLIVTVRGVDDRTLQPMFARALFQREQIHFGEGFGDMVDAGPDGILTVDLRRLDVMVSRPLTKA